MAKCLRQERAIWVVRLDVIERSILTRHASRESYTVTKAMENVVTRALTALGRHFAAEESEARGTVQDEPSLTSFPDFWPTFGPLSRLTNAERRFVCACVDATMEMAMKVIEFDRISRSKHDVMERGNEGNRPR